MRIAFLTPNLPPIVCGLADHTKLISHALTQEGCEVSALGIHGNIEESRVEMPSLSEIQLWDWKADSINRFIQKKQLNWLLLQLSGYGYSRWGAPWRLYRIIREVFCKNQKCNLGVIVHETHCRVSQLGWKGVLLSPIQKYAVGAIARKAARVFPTNKVWEEMCMNDYGIARKNIYLIPIASNVPHIPADAKFRADFRRDIGSNENENIAVLFGSWATQISGLKRLGIHIKKMIDAGDISRLVLVGGNVNGIPNEVNEILRSLDLVAKATILGQQPPEQISRILTSCDWGVIPTQSDLWEKSGSARACEQAGLRLMLYDLKSSAPVIVRPASSPPTWKGIAKELLAHLSI